MDMRHCLLILLLFTMASATSSILYTAIRQVIKEINTQEFKGLPSCDLFFFGFQNLLTPFFMENMDTSVIILDKHDQAEADINSMRQLVTRNSKCLILLMAASNRTNAKLIEKMFGPIKNSAVVNVALGGKTMDKVWTQTDLDAFPRSIFELLTNSFEAQVAANIFCTKNMGYTNLPNVNLWIYSKNEERNHPMDTSSNSKMFESNIEPLKPLQQTLPRYICPHPLDKSTLRVSYLMTKPLVFQQKSAEYGLGGTDVSVLKLLRDKYKFKISFLVEPVGLFNISTNKWTGSFGKLIDKQLDLRIGACAARSIVDYTGPLFYSEFKWVSRMPIPLPKHDQFLIAFTSSVWIATLLTLFVLSVLFAVVYYIYKTKLSTEKDLIGYLPTPADFFLKTFASLMEPDPICWFPRFSAGRFLLMIWSIFCLNINNFYLSNLRTNLMRQNYEKPIDTSADVVKRNQTVYIEIVSYNAFFRNQKLPDPYVEKAVSMAADRHGLYNSAAAVNAWWPDYVIRGIFEKGSAVGAGSLTLHFLGQILGPKLGLEKFHVSRDNFGYQYMVFCFRKDTVWVKDLDKSLSHMFEMGILSHILDKELPPTVSSTLDLTDEVKPFTMEQIISICYFLGIGICIGSIAFVIEVLPIMAKKLLLSRP